MAAQFESDSDLDEIDIPDDDDDDDDDENARKGYCLLTAAERNDVVEIARILGDDDGNSGLVNFHDRDGYTPLHRASHNNHVESMKMLMSKGAEIDGRTNDGWQPLHSAIRWNMIEAADLLIRCGADINARTVGNLTPLHLAASLKDSRKILLMLLSNADLDATIVSGAGETAYDIAYRTSANVKLFEMVEPSLNEI